MSAWHNAASKRIKEVSLNAVNADATPDAPSGVPRSVRVPALALGAVGIAAGLIFLGWAYGAALRAPAFGMFHDDGIYAVTAKALATGRGYRIVSLPGEIAQTKYPFLFPALLAAVWRVFPRFPENLIWLKLVPLASTVAWGALAYRLFRAQTASKPVSMALTGLMTVAPWVLFLGTALLSETLFAALLTGALLLLGRLERANAATSTSGAGWRAVVGVALLSSAAFLTRTVGITLIATGVLVLLMQGRWRRLAAFTLICVGLCGPWVWWQAHQDSAALDIEPYYSRVNYQSWNILSFSTAQRFQILKQNLAGMALAPATLAGVPVGGCGPLLALAAGALVAAGFSLSLSRRPAALEIFVALYTGLVLCWAWPPVRFMAPLLPALLVYGYRGTRAACSGLKVSRRATRTALAAVALVFLVVGGWSLARLALAARDYGTLRIPGIAQDDWQETVRMFTWLRENSAPDAVLAGNLDPILYLYTGRKSIRGFVQNPYLLHYGADKEAWPLGSADQMLAALRSNQVRYLVCAPNASFREGPYLERLTGELRRDYPASFHLAYQSADGRYRIYAVALDASGDNLSHKPNFHSTLPLLGSN
jgi:hypothetical protein